MTLSPVGVAALVAAMGAAIVAFACARGGEPLFPRPAPKNKWSPKQLPFFGPGSWGKKDPAPAPSIGADDDAVDGGSRS